MSGQAPVQAQLEASLKATLLDLSRILAFQARLQQHGVAQYAPAAPKHLTQALQGDAAQFAAICDGLEHRVLKAIATLERDARRAAGLSPARPTSPAPADPLAPIEPAKPATEAAATEQDDVKLPFSLPTGSTSDPSTSAAPPDAATMQLDLTLSPSPPPAAPSTTTDSTLPFQLPGSSILPPSSSAMMLDLTGDDAAPAPVPASTNGAPDLGGGDANADLNALLASLNMPPFDNSLASTSLPMSSTGPSSSSAPPPATASTAFPALSLDALNALLAGSVAPTASAATAPASAQPSALDSLGLSLAPPAPSTVSAAPDLGSLDFSSSSFGGFGADAGGAGAGAGAGAGGGGLGDGFDFTSFAAAPSGTGAGDASLEELLRSLGGGM